MLDLIRKKQKSVFIKLAFAVIILSFVIGYAMLTSPGDGRDGQQQGFAVAVNDLEVGFNEYETVYSNLYRLYQNVYREQFNPALEKQLGLRQQALDTVIEQALLFLESHRLGTKVNRQELIDSIAQIPAFQDNGVFSKERYLQVLNYQRITPDDFEARQEQQLLAEKVRDAIRGQIEITDEDIVEEYRRQNEKVNLDFVRLAPALFETRVKVDEEALAAFFDARKEDFRFPETVALRYLLFEPGRYAKDVTTTEEDLEKYYRRHLDRFDIAEQVKASHILIKVPLDADQETKDRKRQLADKVLEEVRAGKDFATLVRKYSDDQGTIAQDGDLGFFSRGIMVADFEKAAFAMKPGNISDIVTTPFGYHIIRCDGYIEPGIKPLADVLDEVKTEVVADKSRQLAFEKAMDAFNINRKTADLDNAAKVNDLGIKETNFFEREAPIDGLGEVPEISAAAFALSTAELARPVNLPEGVVLFAIKERRASRLPELTEVRVEVEQAYRQQHTEDLARKTAEELLAAVANGEALESQAKAQRLTVEETGLFTRAYGNFLPRLGNLDQLAEAAFELTAEKPAAPQVYENDGKFIVAALKERVEADLASLDDAQRETLKTTVLTRKKDLVYQEKIDDLKAKAKIVVSPTIQASIEKEK
ncbi:SurA N-terminal domain-containing protein [Trichloromonas sp.]|uniref:SurA N-terminal domain-containing protein n=1 Tax=Trichloromonas sp. TaxID=3069249 RepID=UPI003D81B194